MAIFTLSVLGSSRQQAAVVSFSLVSSVVARFDFYDTSQICLI